MSDIWIHDSLKVLLFSEIFNPDTVRTHVQELEENKSFGRDVIYILSAQLAQEIWLSQLQQLTDGQTGFNLE